MTSGVDESYRFLAARYVRKQAKQLAEQIDGVRQAEDIEFVHRARVASRRLRAGTRMFRDCFDAKRLKKWRKQISRVTTGLGDARDKDVQIEFLCGVLDALEEKACYPALARLLVESERNRERLQSKVIRAADRLQASGILDEMAAAAKRVLCEAKRRKVSVQSDFALRRTGQHILQRLDQMLSYQDSLADADDRQRHHAMRISAKRLRYTVEIAKPVYGGRLDSAVAVIKKVQTLLGEVHDCDVWLERLERFAQEERDRIVKHFGHAGPFARLEVGIEYLRQERRRHRRQVFRELVDYWQKLNHQAYWGKLVGTVRPRGERSGQPEPPTEPVPEATPKPAPHWKQSNGPEVCDCVAAPFGKQELPSHAQQVGKPGRQVKPAAETDSRAAVSP